MEGADDEIRLFFFQRVDRGDSLFLIGAEIAVGVAELAVDAETKAVRRRHDLILVVFAVGDAVFLKRGPGVALAGRVEVIRVVVGRRDKIDAALEQNIGRGGRRTEGEGLDRGEILVGEGALEIADGVFVIAEILHDVGEGIAVIAVHRGFKMHRSTGRARQRQIADKADRIHLGLRLGGRLRRGLGRGSDDLGGHFRRGGNGSDALLHRDRHIHVCVKGGT